jgi:hypothetical protein
MATWTFLPGIRLYYYRTGCYVSPKGCHKPLSVCRQKSVQEARIDVSLFCQKQKEQKRLLICAFLFVIQSYMNSSKCLECIHKRDRTEPASGSLYSYTQDSNPEG